LRLGKGIGATEFVREFSANGHSLVNIICLITSTGKNCILRQDGLSTENARYFSPLDADVRIKCVSSVRKTVRNR